MSVRAGIRLGGEIAGYRVDADRGLVQRSRIDGRSLDALLSEGLGLEHALPILKSAAVTVDSVRWAGGGPHGRLNPEAIVIDSRDGHTGVTGFGAGSGRASDRNSIPPRPAVDYMAPEVLAGAPPDSSADTYALGCVLFEVLAGEVPFPRASPVAVAAAHRDAAPPSPRYFRPELPPGVDAVIEMALAKLPESRYSTCVALVKAAESALEGSEDRRQPSVSFPVTGGPTREPPKRSEPAERAIHPDEAAEVDVEARAENRSGRAGRFAKVGLVLLVLALLGGIVALDGLRSEDEPLVSVDQPEAGSEPSASESRDTESEPESVASARAGEGSNLAGVVGDAVVRIDPGTGQVVAAIPVGAGLVGLAASESALWAVSAGDGTVTKIDPESDQVVATLVIGGMPSGIAARAGSDGVWVVNARDAEIIEISEGPLATDHSRAAFSVGRRPAVFPTGPTSLVVGATAAWVAMETGRANRTRLIRIDTLSNKTTAVAVGISRRSRLELGAGSLWVGDRYGMVRRLDLQTLEPIAEIDVGGEVAGMVWARDALWVSACDDSGGLIAVVKAEPGSLSRRSRVRECSFGIDAGLDSVWVASPAERRVLRLDPANGSILSLIRVDGRPVDLAVTARGVYVALQRRLIELNG